MVPREDPVRFKAAEFEMVPVLDAVIAPWAVMEVMPPVKTVPNCNALASANCTAAEPELARETVPVKSLEEFERFKAPVPALNDVAPAPASWMIGPVCEIPTAEMFKVPEPTFDDAIMMALASLMETLFAPAVLRVTAPTKSLFPDSKVMLVPELKVAVPFA